MDKHKLHVIKHNVRYNKEFNEIIRNIYELKGVFNKLINIQNEINEAYQISYNYVMINELTFKRQRTKETFSKRLNQFIKCHEETEVNTLISFLKRKEITMFDIKVFTLTHFIKDI